MAKNYYVKVLLKKAMKKCVPVKDSLLPWWLHHEVGDDDAIVDNGQDGSDHDERDPVPRLDVKTFGHIVQRHKLQHVNLHILYL